MFSPWIINYYYSPKQTLLNLPIQIKNTINPQKLHNYREKYDINVLSCYMKKLPLCYKILDLCNSQRLLLSYFKLLDYRLSRLG